MTCTDCGDQFCEPCRAKVQAVIDEDRHTPEWMGCPVCVAMTNVCAADCSEQQFDEAAKELDLHPEHRQPILAWLERNPEWAT